MVTDGFLHCRKSEAAPTAAAQPTATLYNLFRELFQRVNRSHLPILPQNVAAGADLVDDCVKMLSPGTWIVMLPI